MSTQPSPDRSLPAHLDLEQLRKQAKELVRAVRGGDADAIDRLRKQQRHDTESAREDSPQSTIRLADAQWVLAREHGFASWPKLKRFLESQGTANDDRAARVAAFIEAACSSKWQEARRLLDESTDLGHTDLYTACVIGDVACAQRHLEADPTLATRSGGPKSWEPLLYVCFSRFLGGDAKRADSMVRIAELLLQNGANANAFFRVNDDPNNKQTALYGAAGIANHAGMTRLLLGAGADPNDDAPGLGPESLYHAAEFSDHRCLRLILEAGPDRDKISYCLRRKLDFDDPQGARIFLEHGADPNFRVPGCGNATTLHVAIQRRRNAATIELLLQHGGDMTARNDTGFTPLVLAVRLGHEVAADVLRRFGANDAELNDIDRFLHACSRGDAPQVRKLLSRSPDLVDRLDDTDRQLLAHAAQRQDTNAVRVMLEAGFDPSIAGEEKMTPLHWAAWWGHAEMVDALLRYQPPLESLNLYGGTPLDTAVYGSMHCHSPHGGSLAGGTADDVRHGDYETVVHKLIAAGADANSVHPFPSGNQPVDAILHPARSESATHESETHYVCDDVKRSDELFRDLFGHNETSLSIRDLLDRQAQALLAAHRNRDPVAAVAIKNYVPGLIGASADTIFAADVSIDALREGLAREHGYDDWDQVIEHGTARVDIRFEQAAEAFVSGDLATLETLLRDDPNLARARSAFQHRATLLHYLAANGVEIRRQKSPYNAPAIAKRLLDAGAEVDALAGSYGAGPNQTTLCLLVSSDHPARAGVERDLIRILIDAGAAVNGLEDDGMPLLNALAFGHTAAVDTLIECGARVDKLVTAAGAGRLDIVRGMFDENDEPSPQSVRYITPFGVCIDDPRIAAGRALVYACMHGRTQTVRFLLDRGVPVDAPLDRGQTGLHWAAYRGHSDVVKMLLERGADANRGDDQHNGKPWEWAQEGGHAEIVNLLQAREG